MLSIKEILEKLSEAHEGGVPAEVILKDLIEEYEPEKAVDMFPEMLELVTWDSGGEGSAEDAPQVVWKYKPTDQLFGIDGWYQSYHGTEWHDEFVEFKAIPTIVYGRK